MKKENDNVTSHFSLISKKEARMLGGGHSLTLGNPKGISPIIAYRFLKENFGPPQRIVKSYDLPYDKIHWTYYLRGINSVLSVFDWKLFSWNIGIAFTPILLGQKLSKKDLSSRKEYEKKAISDARLLLSYITKYAKSVKEISIKKARFQLINNEFLTHYSRGNEFLEIIKKNGTIDKKIDRSEISWAATMSYMISIEALLNIVYEIFVQEKIQSNSDLIRHVERLSTLDKWCLASFLCTCFRKPLEKNSKGYQALNEIRQLRNSMVHSNISDTMRYYFVREDNLPFGATRYPITVHRKYDIDLLEDLKSHDFDSSDQKFVIEIKEAVDLIKGELLDAMHPKHKKGISENLKYSFISFDRIKKQIARPKHEYFY